MEASPDRWQGPWSGRSGQGGTKVRPRPRTPLRGCLGGQLAELELTPRGTVHERGVLKRLPAKHLPESPERSEGWAENPGPEQAEILVRGVPKGLVVLRDQANTAKMFD